MGKLYMKRKNRDKAYRAIPKEQRGNFKRSSIRNQFLHPQYVEDYEQVTDKRLSSADKGFGNQIYKTRFSVLYELSERRF